MPDDDDNQPLMTGQAENEEGGFSDEVADALEGLEDERRGLLSTTKTLKNVKGLGDLIPLVNTIRTHIANNVIPAIVAVLEVLGEEIADTDEIALTAVRTADRNRQLVEHLKTVVEEFTGTKVKWPPAIEHEGDDAAAPIDFDGAMAAYADLALLLEAKLPGDPDVAEVMGRLEAKLTGAALEAGEGASSPDEDDDEAT